MKKWFDIGDHGRFWLGIGSWAFVFIISTAAVTTWRKTLAPTPPPQTVSVAPAPFKPATKTRSSLPLHTPSEPVEVLPQSAWADSLLLSLTLEEKIGQLFMIATYSNRDEAHYRQIERLVREQHIGGLIFFQGGPYRQARLTNRYQQAAKVPLLIGMDAEWGLGMRLDSTTSFPRQMALGAIQHDSLLHRLGQEIGAQCRRLGIHVNFAPVVDVNSNPDNPVIGMRSFGEKPENVTQKAKAYMRGMQQQRVLAVAKHFPGHGDTDTDSHYTLPVVSHSSDQLREIDLYPFKQLAADSLMGILTGHLYVPVLDNTPQLPSSLSEKIVNQLLRKDLGFRGVIFTDAMNMRGVLQSGKAAEVNLKALLAGNDVLLFPEGIAETIAYIKDAVAGKKISVELLDAKVRRILQAKYWAGAHERTPISLTNLHQDLHSPASQQLYRDLLEAATTVVHDPQSLLPIQKIEATKIASVSIGTTQESIFQKTLSRYGLTHHFRFNDRPTTDVELEKMVRLLTPYPTVVVGMHRLTSTARRNYGITSQTIDFIQQLNQAGKQVILCIFGTPYAIRLFPTTTALVCAHGDDGISQQAIAQLLFGALPATGKLPVSASQFVAGQGIDKPLFGRLGYSTPERVGMSSSTLAQIDLLANDAIAQRVFPGCQILIARKGKIIYERAFGNLTYQPNEPATPETLYDLASITKVSATLQAVMMLYDQGSLDLDQKAAYYLPELRKTSKEHITIRQLLLHRSGLVSFYPELWRRTMAPNGELLPKYYTSQADSLYYLQVAPELFAHHSLRDSVWKWVIESPLHNRRDRSGQYSYVYSDLGFLMLQKIVEQITQQPLDVFLHKSLYEPLGINQLTYNPLRRFSIPQIAPTEQDKRFRGQLIRGTVHDQMAAILGGIAGHAGLFGRAGDLAVLLQMNLWNGTYGGRQYLKPETIQLFAKLHDEGRHRGLGWDKVPADGRSNYVSYRASASSYGHTGFTGAVAWVDPEEELIFIFLSNRIHPDPENGSINSSHTRRKIHDLVYQSLLIQ